MPTQSKLFVTAEPAYTPKSLPAHDEDRLWLPKTSVDPKRYPYRFGVRFKEELSGGMTKETALSLFASFPEALEVAEGKFSILHPEYANNSVKVIKSRS